MSAFDMDIRLDERNFSLVRKQLLSNEGDQFVDYMYHSSLGLEYGTVPDGIKVATETLGWGTEEDMAHSVIAACVADSCREFKLWIDRNRRLPFEEHIEYLSQNHFAGKKVAEIGCGMGVHLMSLQEVADEVIGVEPIELYIQMSEILSERELRPRLDIRSGTAENLPLENNTYDVVLCISAHEYLDIVPAFQEISRVLRPGGEVIVIGTTLNSTTSLLNVLKSLRSVKRTALTVLNTLSYMAIEKRILPARSEASTTRPIYPSQRAMRKWLSNAGLNVDPHCPDIGNETVFRAQKPCVS